MIRSMTGYAARTGEVGEGSGRVSLSVELKSVNSRFLDLSFRLADDLRSLEPVLRERIASRVQRGKVECRMALSPLAGGPAHFSPDPALLSALANAARFVQAAIPDARPLTVAEVLHWPGMLSDADRAGDALRAGALKAFDEVLTEYSASRDREGRKLAAAIEERVAAMLALIERAKPALPAAMAAYQEKLSTRLREVLGSGDEDRIRQEIALFGVKFDVAEEVSRLEVHLSEVRRILSAETVAGKRLDFLMQELNREANTLGSKAVSRGISDTAVELKLLIEQMREQVQNIE